MSILYYAGTMHMLKLNTFASGTVYMYSTVCILYTNLQCVFSHFIIPLVAFSLMISAIFGGISFLTPRGKVWKV